MFLNFYTNAPTGFTPEYATLKFLSFELCSKKLVTSQVQRLNSCSHFDCKVFMCDRKVLLHCLPLRTTSAVVNLIKCSILVSKSRLKPDETIGFSTTLES